MNQTTKRTLISLMLVAFLLAACAPAPTPTEDSTQGQFIQDLAAGTVSAFNANATGTQASLPTPALTSTPREVEDVFAELASATPTPIPGTPTNTLSPAEASIVTYEAAFDTYCQPVLETQVAREEIESINRLVSKLEVGKKAIVREPVNLRTQPSLSSRILLVLKPDTEVEIIDGPKKTRLGDGTRYLWWKVKLEGGATGWAVELSACRQFSFMVPPNTATPTP
jgi:SH3 domain-containing protein